MEERGIPTVVAKQLVGSKMPLGNIVFDGDPAPPKKRGTAPQFSAHVYCGQTARCIRIQLGMEVGLGPGDTVLDPDPAPRLKVAHPQFSAHICCDQMAGWIKMPLGTEVDLGPGDCVRWGPSSSLLSPAPE